MRISEIGFNGLSYGGSIGRLGQEAALEAEAEKAWSELDDEGAPKQSKAPPAPAVMVGPPSSLAPIAPVRPSPAPPPPAARVVAARAAAAKGKRRPAGRAPIKRQVAVQRALPPRAPINPIPDPAQSASEVAFSVTGPTINVTKRKSFLEQYGMWLGIGAVVVAGGGYMIWKKRRMANPVTKPQGYMYA